MCSSTKRFALARPLGRALAPLGARLPSARTVLGARLPSARTVLGARAASSTPKPVEAEVPLQAQHFRMSNKVHPLIINSLKSEYLAHERENSNKMGRQQNKIWNKSELDAALLTHNDKHQPVTLSDKLMHGIMYYGLYHPFNFLTGYTNKDPAPQSLVWRLIVLESFAGVPGFTAAAFRHFRSLRVLQRDYGWIHTLLEEAENERMHLLVCLRMFEASSATRIMCIGAQLAMTPFLIMVRVMNLTQRHHQLTNPNP